MPSRAKLRPAVVLTTIQLRKLCDEAEKLRFSHGPNAQFWQDVDQNGSHVVSFWFVHRPNLSLWKGVAHPWNFAHGGGKNVRALVLCKMQGKMKPQALLCEFDHQAFMTLPRCFRKMSSRRTTKAMAW